MRNRKTMTMIYVIILCGLFLVIGAYHYVPQSGMSKNAIFHLNLVIEEKNSNNASAGYQSAFFVLSNGELLSSCNITVPANTLIEITIYNHDTSTDPLMLANAENVSGTYDDSVLLYSNALQNSSANFITSSDIGHYVFQIALNSLSHTFTTSTGLNIPIAPSSIEQAYVTFVTPGTYSWGCMCECGMYSMCHSGWMYGTLLVTATA